jgi:Spy/CpxP family protein refolding chaperone
MNISTSITRTTSRIARPLRMSLALVAMLGGIGVTIVAVAQNATVAGFHHGAHMQMTATTPVDVATRVDAILQHIYVEVGASSTQQAQIAPLVQTAATNLMQLHSQFDAQHAQMLTLLTQDSIDRVALEKSRVALLVTADQTSKQIVQLIADTADVLTPAQRKTLADKLAAHLGSTQS